MMPRKCAVTFAASAVRDMEDIRVWYAGQEADDVGARMVGEIISRVERLSDSPESGPIVPVFGVATLREIIYPPFRTVYRFDRDRVRMDRVWRSKRPLQIPSQRQPCNRW